MRKSGFLVLGLLVIVGSFISSLGCSAPEQTKSLEERAQEINRSLMCPLCSGQTIDQSSSELSTQMRALVREKLEQGGTREEILQFFVERYGEAVLAEPIKSGFNLIVWVTPILAIFVIGIVLWKFAKRHVKKGEILSAGLQSAPQDDNTDEKYREQLEKELKAFDDKGFR